MSDQNNLIKMAVFQEKNIRRYWDKEKELWFFSVVDVIAALTESPNPRSYWKVMKSRLKKEGSEVVTKCNQLKMCAADGKYYLTDAADTETMFRLIQSIPSPNAEPFKLWLARVGYERIQEIEDPELAMKRMRAIYKAKGYSDNWIEKRVRGIVIREELTDEWNKRDIKNQREYAILTAEISKAAFGMTPSEYKKHKGLERQNLRDHMTDLELIFSMLGEASTTKIAKARDSQGFEQNKESAVDGGSIAGNARKELEQKSGENVISRENYIKGSQNKRFLKK